MRAIFSFLLIIGLLFCTAWLIGFIWFFCQVPEQSLRTSAPIAKAPVGIVLTGGKGRIMHGLITLYEGRVQHLYITGVNENVTDQELFSSLGNELGEQLFQKYKKQITVGRNARSTRGNALEVLDYINSRKIATKSIMLITSNYHMPRSMHEFKRVMPKTLTIIAEPSYTPDFPANWWTQSSSALLLISEYHKTVISYVAKTVAQETQLNEFLANNPL